MVKLTKKTYTNSNYETKSCNFITTKAAACTAEKPSTISLNPSQSVTHYHGNLDFKLDLSNLGENLQVRGFFNTEGHSNNHAGFSTAETVLMIFNNNKHIHNFIVGGHHELKKSIFDASNSDLIEGLTTEISGTKYYNALCGNLDYKLQCLPVIINKIEQLTNFHVLNLPSSELGLTIIPNATADKFLINLSHLGHIDDLEANNAANGGSTITAKSSAGTYTIQVTSLDEAQVDSHISYDETTPYICSNVLNILNVVGICTLDGTSA